MVCSLATLEKKVNIVNLHNTLDFEQLIEFWLCDSSQILPARTYHFTAKKTIKPQPTFSIWFLAEMCPDDLEKGTLTLQGIFSLNFGVIEIDYHDKTVPLLKLSLKMTAGGCHMMN